MSKPVVKTSNTVGINDPVETEWNGLFVIAEHWKSDLKFFDDEFRFLKKLIDKYFIWVTDDKIVQQNRLMAAQLSKQKKLLEKLAQKVDKHLHHLTILIENPFPHNSQEYRDEHAALEVKVAEFVKDFRQVKKGVFQLAEDVKDAEIENAERLNL